MLCTRRAVVRGRADRSACHLAFNERANACGISGCLAVEYLLCEAEEASLGKTFEPRFERNDHFEGAALSCAVRHARCWPT